MKLKLLFTVCLFVAILKTQAQAPQAIPVCEAAARNSSGNLITNQLISLRFSIHDATAGGTVIYKETQSAATNSLGLFSINIGQGTVVSGVFASIDWAVNAKFIQVEMDVTGGTNYIDLGTQQMMSVPYAFYAAKTNMPNGTAAGQILIWNGTQWVTSTICSLFNSDVNNCGSCNNVCPPNPANGVSSCVNGVCVVTCNSGFGNCDGILNNGCETNLSNNVSNCSACGAACPVRANATSTCVNGVCSFICNTGFADCNGNSSDGCEVNLNTSPSNCSACNVVCPAGQSCVNGICTLVCPGGLTNCSGTCRNLLTDLNNCGTCGNSCGNVANASTFCAGGACSFNCNAGFANCDGIYNNGCEVNVQTSVTNCGTCGTVCPVRANATTTCTGGVCSFTCNPGFANCNGISTDGCEVNLLTTVSNCGTCGHVCPSGQSCVNGVCQ